MESLAEPVVLDGVAALKAAVGKVLGASRWLTVDQAMVDQFAETTGDRYWIHTDRQRAASGPFGTTIAHGFLTLSLLPQLMGEVLRITGFEVAVNYGADRVRFPAPLRVGSRVRAVVQLDSVEEHPDGVTVRMLVTCEGESSPKPHCVAVLLQRYFFASA